MRLGKKIYLGAIGVLLFLMGMSYFLCSTKGLDMVLHGMVRWVPGLHVTSVTGNWCNLKLSGIKYQRPGISVAIRQLNLSFDLSYLKHSILYINALSGQDVDVVINTKRLTLPRPTQEASKPVTLVSIPYPIILHILQLYNIKVKADNTDILLAELRTGAEWHAHKLTLMPTKIHSLLIMLSKSTGNTRARAIPSGVEVIDKRISKWVNQRLTSLPQSADILLGEMLKALFTKPILTGFPDIQCPLDITIKEINGDNWKLIGDHNMLITHLLLQARINSQHIRLDTFNLELPQGTLSIQGQALLTSDFPVKIVAHSMLNILPLKDEKIILIIHGGLREKLQADLNLFGPVNAQLNIQAYLAKVGLPFSVTLKSKKLQWRQNKSLQYQINDVSLRFNGNAANYVVSACATISGQNIPLISLMLEGKGSIKQFKLDLFRLSALQGNTDLTAFIDWSNGISWNAQLMLRGVNSAKQWPEWPVKLDGKIIASGKLHSGHWQLLVPMVQLYGTVKHNKVMIYGALDGNSNRSWKSPGIGLTVGRSQLSIAGHVDKQNWKVDAKIDAPFLNGTIPGLGGTINGSLKLRGNLQVPELLADLTACNLQWQTVRIHQIKIHANLYSTDQIQSQLTIHIKELEKDTLKVKLLNFNTNGNEKQHKMQLEVDSQLGFGRLALQGGFDRQQQHWHANLYSVHLNAPMGELSFAHHIMLDYLNAAQKVSMNSNGWQNYYTNKYIIKPLEKGKNSEASLVLDRFDLEILKPFLDVDISLSRALTGYPSSSWQSGSIFPQAQVLLLGNGVKVVQKIHGNALSITFDIIKLSAQLKNGFVEVDWLIKLKNNGQFNGHLQVEDPRGIRNINGNINITNISLSVLNPALIQAKKAAGILNAKLRLSSSAQKMMVFGRLMLDKAQVQGHYMPFDMIDSRLVIHFNGITSTLEGQINTKSGQLNIAGNADWREPNSWCAYITAKSNKLRIAVPPMISIDLSLDLVFKAMSQRLLLNGSVSIPWARIMIQELPASVVGISSDEVMINNQLKPIQSKAVSIPINSNLMIHIGDDVWLDAFGLKAGMKGDLKVVQDKKGLGLNGQIDITSGRFHAYGQDLIARKGQLIFSGPPDQPMLNIEAIRNPESTEDEVTVGVRVTGSAGAPKLEVFSNPVKSQQEALSYLLRGQGLDRTSTNSSAMTSMLISMGVAQSGQLLCKIGEAFGVSDLSLNTQGVGESSQVAISGYILHGLQVKYVVGIFDSLATLTLRYRLMPKLYLEAVSGIDQALDLLYQFDFS